MQSLMKFTFLVAFFVGTTITTSFSQSQESIIVINGGLFGGVDYANISIENLSTGSFTSIDTIYTTSIQDVVVNGQEVYVAAQDSIVKYDLVTQSRVAANAFGAPSTIKLAIYGNHLLVGNWYAPWGFVGAFDNHFRIFNTSDLSLADSIPEVTKPATDFVVVGDYAYIAQNNVVAAGYGDTLGYLAVVNLNTMSFERYDTLSTTGDDIGRLVADGDMIYSINSVSNTISSYNTVNQVKTNQASTAISLSPKKNGPTAFTKGNGVWYFPFDNGIGAYNLSTNTVVTADIVTIPGSFAFTMDTFNNTFCVSHIYYGSQGNNTGKIYDMTGDSIASFEVGFSPEALAIVSQTGVAVTAIASEEELKYTIFPNPVQSILNVEFAIEEEVTLMLINSVGQVVLQEKTNETVTSIAVEYLPAGVYFIAVANEEGVLRTQRFVKK
jgi:hypothetical protein